MRFLIVVLGVLCLLPSFTHAQVPDIQWGKEEKAEKRSWYTRFVGVAGGGHYEIEYSSSAWVGIGFIPIKVAREKFYIKHYDEQLKLIKSQEFDLQYKGKNRSYHSSIYAKGNLYVFSRFYDKKADKNFLYVDRIDLSTLEAVGTPTLIAEIPAERRNNAGYFSTSFSRDSSKVMIAYDYGAARNRRDERKELMAMAVYDSELNLLWEQKDIEFEFADRRFRTLTHKVDNEGNGIIIGKVYNDDGRKRIRERDKDGKPNYRFLFRSYREEGTAVEDYIFDSEDRFITSMKVELDQNRHLACAGFYSDDRNYSITSGIFYFHLNPVDMSRYGETFQDFDKRTLELLSRGEATKKGELRNWSIDKLVVRLDGGALIVAEQYYSRTVTYTDGNGVTHSYTMYYYMNILVTSIDALGEVEWVNVIPKEQISRNITAFSSFYPIILPERVVLIFNDHEANINALPGDRIKNFTRKKNKGIVSMVSIDQDGEVSRDVLYSLEKIKKSLRTSRTRQFSRNGVMIISERKGKFQRGRLTF